MECEELSRQWSIWYSVDGIPCHCKPAQHAQPLLHACAARVCIKSLSTSRCIHIFRLHLEGAYCVVFASRSFCIIPNKAYWFTKMEVTCPKLHPQWSLEITNPPNTMIASCLGYFLREKRGDCDIRLSRLQSSLQTQQSSANRLTKTQDAALISEDSATGWHPRACLLPGLLVPQ